MMEADGGPSPTRLRTAALLTHVEVISHIGICAAQRPSQASRSSSRPSPRFSSSFQTCVGLKAHQSCIKMLLFNF